MSPPSLFSWTPGVVCPDVVVVGESPVDEAVLAMKAAGLSDLEVNIQLSAMRALEENRRREIEQTMIEAEEEYQDDVVAPNATRPRGGSFSNNELLSPSVSRARTGSVSNSELLDRENHSVVEILTSDEYQALENCWPGTTLFAIRFTVSNEIIGIVNTGSVTVHFNTPVCRDCDATGRSCSFVIKNRARGWLKKSSEKARAPASLEY
jgi:hypothetical protein